MLNIIKIIVVMVLFLIAGCHSEDSHVNEEVHEHPAISITQYSNSTELFMEYPVIIVNKEAEFLIHLTDLKDFGAVVEGTLKIEFINKEGVSLSKEMAAPTRAGIYIPQVKFSTPGNYSMNMSLEGKQVSDKIIVENIHVYGSASVAPHKHVEKGSSISFLKEQQWKIEFASEPVISKVVQQSIIATGEINPKPEYFSKVVSPVSGIVLNKNNTNLKTTGTYVSKGSALLNISPTAEVRSNIQNIKSDFLLAEAEYERVKELYENKAVSKKRYDESKFDFEAKSVSYNSVTDQVKITDKGYAIISPISGYVQNINFVLGSHIEAGEELFTIINPSKLVLEANVPLSKADVTNNSTNASFKVEGINEEFLISELGGKKLSTSTSINHTSRTIPIYYEFDNPKNRIKVGMHVEAFIKIGKPTNVLAIPETAIISEDGLQTAYIQLEGESFEKRILLTGIKDKGYIQVIDGINIGERVVTKGAYQIRLAAISPDSEIGHGHAH